VRCVGVDGIDPKCDLTETNLGERRSPSREVCRGRCHRLKMRLDGDQFG
jgi:hypothetical protein